MKTTSINKLRKKFVILNDKALKITEKTFLASFEKIEKSQNKTKFFLKKVIEMSDKKQDKLFDNLENGKKMIWKNLNKGLDFIGKK
jgi:hypothetical protein